MPRRRQLHIDVSVLAQGQRRKWLTQLTNLARSRATILASLRNYCARDTSRARLQRAHARARPVHDQPPSFFLSSSFSWAGFALPPVAFITWPTKKPKSLSLPAR
jgi:hypothetical protein